MEHNIVHGRCLLCLHMFFADSEKAFIMIILSGDMFRLCHISHYSCCMFNRYCAIHVHLGEDFLAFTVKTQSTTSSIQGF
ncbi:hypothetical protein QL285_093061 [Trifolium repens]|nr:hypothetical protein QL285_093061 [Trifolium repens]